MLLEIAYGPGTYNARADLKAAGFAWDSGMRAWARPAKSLPPANAGPVARQGPLLLPTERGMRSVDGVYTALASREAFMREASAYEQERALGSGRCPNCGNALIGNPGSNDGAYGSHGRKPIYG